MKRNPILNPEITEIPAPPVPKKFGISPLFIIILLSLTFVSSICAAYYYGVYQNRVVSNLTTISPYPTATPSLVPQDENPSEYGILTWNSAPKKVANPDVLAKSLPTPANGYSESFGYSFADLGTYEVAKFSKGATLLVSFVSPEGPSSPSIFRIISDKGKYFLVESLINDDYTKKNLDQIFDTSKIKFISYQIKDLFNDSYYSAGSFGFSALKSGYFLPQFITSIKNYKTVSSLPIGDMLSVDSPIYGNTDLVSRSYYLKLHDSTLVAYTLSSVVASSDNRVPYFNYLDNSVNKSQFTPQKVGCGGGFDTTVIVNQSLLNDKTLVGKNGNVDIYQIKSASSPLVKYLYEQYKGGRDYPSAPPILSLDNFAQAPNHIIFQEKNGDWALLINGDYAVQAECGKPVVYLYPTKDTIVNLSVGASVTKSEPAYRPGIGWTGVLARPSGQLSYLGQTYPSLYWEGQGYGVYPNLRNYGVVVSQKKLVSTLKLQLTQLGLNTQESADFMEFWIPKLPTSPYIRLTWLVTKEMDQLAPLSVNPKPDTSIRVFLDFAALDKPIKLIPQTLTAIPRTGFTLVEWGGLLVK